MLGRVTSGPYIYFAFCILCGAGGGYLFGPMGALYGYGAGIILAIIYLVRKLRELE